MDRIILTYHKGADGMMYPDLAMPEQKHYHIGKYGDLRLDFLKKHRRGTYSLLVGECRLNEHLHDINVQAKETVNRIMYCQEEYGSSNQTMKIAYR